MSHGNVMVSWYGAIKVMDFGIAKLREATQAPGSALISGKPAYMSPEQATTAVAIDGRSDLFAVGIMLWELMTGQFLFQRDNQQATLAAVLFDRISAPSTLRRDVPADLEAVTMRLLERDLAARYQTAQEAYAAVMACGAALSRGAKLELQQAMRARFPDRAARSLLPPPAGSSEPNAPGSPRALAAWQPEGTTHSHAVGQSAIEAPAHPPRSWRVAAAAIGVGLGAAVAVAALVGQHRADPTSVTPDPAAMMPSPTPAPRSPVPPSSATLQRPPNASAPSPSPVTAMSTLAIVTEPSDAMLRVEDATKLIAAGRSPLTLPAPQGTRVRIRAEATGFEPMTKAITIGDVDQQAVTLSLVPLARPDLAHSTSVPQSNPAPIAKPAPKSPRSPAKPTDSDDKIME